MTPEQRAEKLWPYIVWAERDNEDDVTRRIAHAIRSAENAALERAARHFPYKDTQAFIRSLKTRAPRAKGKR